MKNRLKARLIQAVMTVLVVVWCPFVASAQLPVVSMHLDNVTLKEFLTELQVQCPDYTLAYADSDLPVEKLVTVNVDNVDIRSLIAKVLPWIKVQDVGS